VPAYVAVVVGPQHHYAFVNEAFMPIIGIDDPIGKEFGASGHATTPGLREKLDEVYATGEPWTAREMRISAIRGQADDRWFDVSFLPLRGEDGAVYGVLLHSFDVTSLVRARRAEEEKAALQQQLLHAQKLESLGVLAGGIAHDFNNMLTVVQGGVTVASLTLPADHRAQPALKDALEAVRRAASLTRELLAYSGKARFAVRRLDLSAQVSEIVRLLEATLPKKVSLALDLAASLPSVSADPAQLQQVVMNLVINGAEAIGDARGSVRVSTGVTRIDPEAAGRLVVAPRDPGAEHVLVEVKDSGSGMDEETRAKIFDPFFTTKFTGRGLGLAAVLGIVRAHAGALSVESAVGAGTTFRVYFPADPGLPEAREESPAESFRARGKVLVVDDDPGVRTAYRRLLSQFGLEVVEAQDGRRGVEALAEHHGAVAAVLLDMTMPDMNGEETLRELRRIDPRVPVILASGYTDVEAGERFAGADIVAFLAKPFSANELVRCLRAAGL